MEKALAAYQQTIAAAQIFKLELVKKNPALNHSTGRIQIFIAPHRCNRK
jgi:hypothetical protein